MSIRSAYHSWLLLASVWALVLFGALAAQRIETSFNEDSRRAYIFEHAAALGARIERQLVEAIEIANATAVFIAEHPDLDAERYARYASGLRQDRDYILNIAAAPDFVVKFVHPHDGNSSVIGFDARASEAQREAVETAIRFDRPVVAGPLKLVQGGDGFIIRNPVTVAGGPGGSDRLWGLISVVMSTELVLALAHDEGLSDIDVAIRGQDGLGQFGGLVTGNRDVFSADPVLFNVELPFGKWQIGMSPMSGWRVLPPRVAGRIWLIAAAIGLISTASLLLVLRYKSRKDRAEGELAAAIESIEDGFAMFDAEDRLLLSNSKYGRMYDLPGELTVRGTPFEDILRFGLDNGHYPAAAGREEDWLVERLQRHRNPTGSFNQQLYDGRWTKIAESKTKNGIIVGFRVDITDLKTAQEEAERAHRIKSQILNNINHEMRTPLTVILGYLPMLANVKLLAPFKTLSGTGTSKPIAPRHMSDQLDALAAEIRSIAGSIEGAGKHLLALVNDSLDLAQIESGKLDIQKRPVALAALLAELKIEFGQMIREKGLALDLKEVEATVLADPVRLRQILVNLIENAIKFTADGGITVTASREGHFVRVDVTDTGCGISETHLPHVFEEFYQGDGSTTRKYGGTGLGLAICRRLVDLHGGSIRVASQVGTGTTFSVKLLHATGAVETHASAARRDDPGMYLATG